MAIIQERGGRYRVQFFYRGKRHSLSLGKVPEAEAEAWSGKVDYLLMKIKQGFLAVPPGVDIVQLVLNVGKVPPDQTPRASNEPLTLGGLRDRYFETHRNGSLEQTALDGVALHFKHFVSAFGERFPIQGLSLGDLQRYVDRRTRARGIRGQLSPATIKKEIDSLRTAWNWAVRLGLAAGRFPYDGLRYPKLDEKPTSQTRAEIDRKIAMGGLSKAEVAALWDGPVRHQPEIEEVLCFAQNHAGHGWIYPALAFAAHASARRSEIIRLRTHDLDL